MKLSAITLTLCVMFALPAHAQNAPNKMSRTFIHQETPAKIANNPDFQTMTKSSRHKQPSRNTTRKRAVTDESRTATTNDRAARTALERRAAKRSRVANKISKPASAIDGGSLND